MDERTAINLALHQYGRALIALRAAEEAWTKTEHTAELAATRAMIASLEEGIALGEDV